MHPSTNPANSVITDQDVRDIVRLLGDAVAAKGDLFAKRRLVMNGLLRIVDADAWAWSLAHLEMGSPPRQVVFLHEGIPQERLPHFLSAIEHDDIQWIMGRFIQEAVTQRLPMTRRDQQLFDEWPEGSEAYRKWVDDAHLRSHILMAWPLETGGYSSVGLFRESHRPFFGPRETRIAHILLTEIPWLHEEGWGEERGESLLRLAKRPREILSLLVQGRSRPQIADDLGVSIHTVNGYVRDIFKHFRVNSHLELISRFTKGDGGDIVKDGRL